VTLQPEASCIIAGGGPAGIMCGYLLARAGVRVAVLEKHHDFFRDFRGDTIHPSTLQLMNELGELDRFLAIPHQDISYAEANIGDRRIRMADFTHLPVAHQRLVFMPQWDFLNFLAERARRLPGFTLLMDTEATGLLREGNRVTGLRARSRQGEHSIKATALVIAADGRDSVLRRDAGLTVQDLGAPMDVMWFRLEHREGEEHAVLGRIAQGQALIMLFRGDYWQCALIIRKGAAEEVRNEGLAAFRARVAALARRKSVDEIRSWEDVKLLTVRVDRLKTWHQPGLLFIGDAAHAMSPIGGVGINLAIQDAVATANLLHAPLRRGMVSDADLARIQQRRMFPTRVTQRIQTAIQDRIIDPVLRGAPPRVSWPLELLQAWPWLQRLPARAIGLGVRPEHILSPETAA
jgi:2-polyprenyl-6-methoxyphenol hydroxylase-like FAD-dependent oxidoreductase